MLAFYLVLINPISFVANASQSIFLLMSDWRETPTPFVAGIIVEILGGLGIVIFGMYCGVAIRKLRKKAILQTKAFVILSICWLLLSGLSLLVIVDFVGAPTDIRSEIRQYAAIRILPWIVFFLAVYAYLATSNRVRATFGTK